MARTDRDERRCGRRVLDNRRRLGRHNGGIQNVAILRLNLSPDGSRGLADAVLGNEFAGHRCQHIVVFIE